jgi:hypothetical protein
MLSTILFSLLSNKVTITIMYYYKWWYKTRRPYFAAQNSHGHAKKKYSKIMVNLGTRSQKRFATLTLGISLNESLLSAISYNVFINEEFLVGTYNYCCYKRGRRPQFICQRVVFIFVWTIRTASRWATRLQQLWASERASTERFQPHTVRRETDSPPAVQAISHLSATDSIPHQRVNK